MKYLVTGGAGFIGSHVIEELVGRGEDVEILSHTFNIENLKNAKANIKWIKGSVENLELLKECTTNTDYIIHLAALVCIPESYKKEDKYFDVNVTGTYNVLEAATINKVKRVVFASSASIYGNAKSPIKETMECKRTDLTSPYARQKHIGEVLCRNFNKSKKVETVILRFFNVFGPRQNLKHNAVISTFIDQMKKGKRPTIYGNGKQIRDFVYVKDLANAAIEACTKKSTAGKTINIASGKGMSLLQVIDTINKIQQTNIKPTFKKKREGDIQESIADITKMKKLLGNINKTNFGQALKETMDEME